MHVFGILKSKNSSWKVATILPFLHGGEKILDYGCGDLSFALALKNTNPSFNITGVDVSEYRNENKNIHYVRYDGTNLPFRSKSFDTVVSIYVFHHVNDPEKALNECLRVARKRVIFVESVVLHPMLLPYMKFVDWFFNFWKPEPVPLTYQFRSLKEWGVIFKKSNVRIRSKLEIRGIFSFLPASKTYLFEVMK